MRCWNFGRIYKKVATKMVTACHFPLLCTRWREEGSAAFKPTACEVFRKQHWCWRWEKTVGLRSWTLAVVPLKQLIPSFFRVSSSEDYLFQYLSHWKAARLPLFLLGLQCKLAFHISEPWLVTVNMANACSGAPGAIKVEKFLGWQETVRGRFWKEQDGPNTGVPPSWGLLPISVNSFLE